MPSSGLSAASVWRFPARTALVLAIAFAALVSATCLYVVPALADDVVATQSSPVTDAVPSELQQRVEETAAAYNEAVAARENAEQQVADCQARIAEIEAQLPAAQDRAAEAIYTSYRFQQNGASLLTLILSADDFNSFLATLQYLANIEQHNTNQLNELVALSEELASEETALEAALEQARADEQAAEEALAEAQAARQEAQRQAEERARQEAAARQAAAAAAAAQASSSGGTTESASVDSGASADDSGWSDAGDATVDDGGSTDTGGSTVDWTSDRDAFIASWGARIDNYLAGSTLAGYGSVFAAAAWDYGVDPRWSPAIAYVESSLGAYCFLPHNAWGWGSVSWSSWEEAIYGHVAGLARGYGYTLDYEAALSYCPPNADYWYSSVASQMARI